MQDAKYLYGECVYFAGQSWANLVAPLCIASKSMFSILTGIAQKRERNKIRICKKKL